MGELSEVIIPIGGVLDITGEVVMMMLIVAVIAVISLIAGRSLKERPGRLQNVIETGLESLDGFFSDLLGSAKARKYYYFLASMFIFIIFSNYSGLIPGVGLTKYIKAPTSSLSVTAGLGIMSFLFLQISALRHNTRHYLKHFVSPIVIMLPLMLLDEIVKPVSLSLRLFGNIFGEETVTEKLYEILPIGAPLLMMVLSLLFCAIQAIVYTMLVSLYLSEATEDVNNLFRINKR